MKIVFPSFLLLISLISRAQSNIDVLHYKFSIELNDNNDSIYGKAELKIIPNKDINSFQLNLSGDKSGKSKGMIVEKALVNRTVSQIQRGISLGDILHVNDKLIITFVKEILKDDTFYLSVNYKGIPKDGLIISKNKYGNRTFFADNWPNRAHNWIPCVDDPADKASVEFLVTAPSHYQVISNGVMIEETNLPGNKKLTHYREDVPLPTKVMVIGAADFAVQYTGTVGCVPVSSWVYPENKEAGFYDYAIAKDILEWHSNYIGPYAYKKLANVQSKTKFGGMENAGAIFYAEEKITGKREEERLLSHEIVHQWFGNMATEKSFAHLWLSEGFATYLTHVYMEARYGTDSLNKEMMEDREQIIDFVKYARRPVVDSTANFMQLLNANSYQKGGWVLHMLRRQLGDSIFKKSIRQYYATYAGKNADTKDLQKIFETVSGKNLSIFFNQWLFTPVNPHLKFTWNYDVTGKKINITVNQVQQDKIFELPMELLLKDSKGNAIVQKIWISKKTETFRLKAEEKPLRIITDPNVSVLFEGTITESK